MKKILLCLTVIAVSLSATAQKSKKTKREERRQRINAMIKQEEEGVLAYKKHTVYGIKLTSDGYGAFLEIGKSKSIKKAMLFQFEISERKHQKENKESNPLAPTSPIIYGKLNYFYPIKLGVQQQILLGNKSNKNGVSVTANFGGGLIAGLLRPYQVEVVDGSGQQQFIKYEDNTNLFLNGPYIGGPNLGTGWKDLKVTPGIYAKPSVRFDYGRYNEMVSAIETGLSFEFYTKKIPQMVDNKQKQFFFSAYVSFLFGRRK